MITILQLLGAAFFGGVVSALLTSWLMQQLQQTQRTTERMFLIDEMRRRYAERADTDYPLPMPDIVLPHLWPGWHESISYWYVAERFNKFDDQLLEIKYKISSSRPD